MITFFQIKNEYQKSIENWCEKYKRAYYKLKLVGYPRLRNVILDMCATTHWRSSVLIVLMVAGFCGQ